MICKNINIEYIAAFKGICEIEGLHHIKTLPCFSIVMPVKGYYTLRLGSSETYTIREGNAFLAPSRILQDITHHLPSDSGNEGRQMEIKWVFINVKIDDLYQLDDLYEFPPFLEKYLCSHISSYIDSILSIKGNSLPDCNHRNLLAHQLLEEILPFGKEKENLHNEILPAIKLIREHYNQKITTAMLAAVCILSPSVFLRRFKAATGATPSAYLLDYRLSKASALLLTTKMPVGEIAAKTGFYDQFYFTRCFRKKYHASPLKYRNTTF